MTDTGKKFDWLDYLFKLTVVAALIITGIVLASDIIVPMAFAGLLSVVMLPLVRKLENRGLGTALSISIVLLITIVGLGLFLWLTVNQVVGLANDLPNLQAKLDAFISRTQTILSEDFGVTASKQTEMLGDLINSVTTYLGAILLSTTNVLSIVIQIPIYIFLFLIYRGKFKNFILEILPDSGDLKWKQQVEGILQGYISGLFLVTLIVAFLNSVGLLIVGIDHAIFFGILSGVLTIIPYVGIIIGSLFPIMMALITRDSIWYTIGVIIVFVVVQFLEGNFITPRITGSKVSINALAAIIALVIGGKILGIAGMILSIPAIGIIKIVLSYSNHLRPFVILLEDTPSSSTLKIPEKTTPVTSVEREPVVPGDPTVSQ